MPTVRTASPKRFEPTYSLPEAVELLKEDSPDMADAVGTAFGAAVALSPVVLGPAGFALWPLLDAKNELVQATRRLLGHFQRPPNQDFMTRLDRVKQAYTITIHASFLEVAGEEIDHLAQAAGVPKRRLHELSQGQTHGGSQAADAPSTHLLSRRPPTLGPLTGARALSTFVKGTYSEYAQTLQATLAELGRGNASNLEHAISELQQKAIARFNENFTLLALQYNEVYVWAVMNELLDPQKYEIASPFVQETLVAIRDSSAAADVGLRRLESAVRAIPAGLDLKQASEAEAGLYRAYAADVEEPIAAEDTYVTEPLAYPTRAEAFIPQSFSAVEYSPGQQRLEDESFWNHQKTQDDVGSFLLQHLLTARAIHRPTIILGHPGSGKSLLTQMLAARLAPPLFTSLRVELRDTIADDEIQSQIEEAVRRSTGKGVDWTVLASESSAPPIVLFDGLDELLQATGRAHANFLQRLADFQRREFIQGRPVRVIVTSRVALIDRAKIPGHSCVLRLAEFDAKRQAMWIARWNSCNSKYFTATGVRPFELPKGSAIRSLARQPLLLLMLAVYDSQGNSLADESSLSRTELYESLIRRFIERERKKGKAGLEFGALEKDTQIQIIQADFYRLAVAALGMYNRKVLYLSKRELDSDLTFFCPDHRDGASDGQALGVLSPGEMLLGSFFFVHQSKASTLESSEEGGTGAASAFEFLHNTFGEFLVAWFMVSRALEQAELQLEIDRTSERLRARFGQRLSEWSPLEAGWYGTFIYSELFSRPVVVNMLQEWAASEVRRRGWAQEAVASALDGVIVRELETVASGSAVGSPLWGNCHPGLTDIGFFGRASVYTSNLVLLRAGIIGSSSKLNLGGGDESAGIWRRLSGLWQGWFPQEELLRLAGSVRVDVEADALSISLRQRSVAPRDAIEALLVISRFVGDEAGELVGRVAAVDEIRHLEDLLSRELRPDAGLLVTAAARVMRWDAWQGISHPEQRDLAIALFHAAEDGVEHYPNASLEVALICSEVLGSEALMAVLQRIVAMPPAPGFPRFTLLVRAILEAAEGFARHPEEEAYRRLRRPSRFAPGGHRVGRIPFDEYSFGDVYRPSEYRTFGGGRHGGWRPIESVLAVIAWHIAFPGDRSREELLRVVSGVMDGDFVLEAATVYPELAFLLVAPVSLLDEVTDPALPRELSNRLGIALGRVARRGNIPGSASLLRALFTLSGGNGPADVAAGTLESEFARLVLREIERGLVFGQRGYRHGWAVVERSANRKLGSERRHSFRAWARKALSH